MKTIIQVGLGVMGNRWARVISESQHWDIAALVDVNEEALHAAAERINVPRDHCFTSVEEALAARDADALVDVTPQEFRRGVCLAAFEKGLHVLSEKPLADTLENAVEIVQKAQEAGSTYMVAQNYRYSPLPMTTREALRRGDAGDVAHIQVQFHKGPHFGGFREKMEFPLILDMAIHHVDLMRFLMDADVTAVEALSFNPSWSWFDGDASVAARLELSNGTIVSYSGSWVANGWETSWNGNWRFDGAEGVLLWDSDQLFSSTSSNERQPLPLVDMPHTGQPALLEAFRQSIEAGAEPETSGRRNINSLAATFAMVRAAKDGRRVQVDELLP
jgi:predicted dehydrogenase